MSKKQQSSKSKIEQSSKSKIDSKIDSIFELKIEQPIKLSFEGKQLVKLFFDKYIDILNNNVRYFYTDECMTKKIDDIIEYFTQFKIYLEYDTLVIREYYMMSIKSLFDDASKIDPYYHDDVCRYLVEFQHSMCVIYYTHNAYNELARIVRFDKNFILPIEVKYMSEDKIKENLKCCKNENADYDFLCDNDWFDNENSIEIYERELLNRIIV
jgi:hypothetical protein